VAEAVAETAVGDDRRGGEEGPGVPEVTTEASDVPGGTKHARGLEPRQEGGAPQANSRTQRSKVEGSAGAVDASTSSEANPEP
jgi:hypothetical protein